MNLSDKLKNIKSWNDLVKNSFVDYGLEEIKSKGQDTVPFFDESKHCKPGYTGFVRSIEIVDPTSNWMNPSYLEKARFAYIEDGVIRFINKREDRQLLEDPNTPTQRMEYRDGNFKVIERFTDITNPPMEPIFVDMIRSADFPIQESNLKIRVEQYLDKNIKLTLGESWKNVFKNEIINLKLRQGSPSYDTIIENMRKSPELFSDIKKVITLFGDLKMYCLPTSFIGEISTKFPDLLK